MDEQEVADWLTDDASQAVAVSEAAEAAVNAVVNGYGAEFSDDDHKMFLHLVIEALGQAA